MALQYDSAQVDQAGGKCLEESGNTFHRGEFWVQMELSQIAKPVMLLQKLLALHLLFYAHNPGSL